jgi:integrase
MKIFMRLYRRADNGIWYIALSRQKRISTGTKDKAQALRLFRRAKAEYLDSKIAVLSGAPARKTLAEFADEYLEYRAATVARDTCRADSLALRRAVAHLGGHTPLSRLKAPHIAAWQAALASEISPASVNVYLRHVKAAFFQAVKWGYLNTNPCQGVKLLRVQEDFPRYLTHEEVARILAAETCPVFRLFWRFMVAAGCRRSEALGITAKDVDCARRRIALGQTKNRRPRQIIINQDVAAVLWEMLPDVGRLWPWKKDYVSHRFQRIAQKAGVKCRLHDLRHTYGSWLAMAGVPLQTIRDLMGHQDVQTTLVYARLSQEHLTHAAEKISLEHGFAPNSRSGAWKSP